MKRVIRASFEPSCDRTFTAEEVLLLLNSITQLSDTRIMLKDSETGLPEFCIGDESYAFTDDALVVKR